MASFPTSPKTFATRSQGQTIASAHINDLQDEVNAVQAGYLNGTARLNSSNSTVNNLVVLDKLGVNRGVSTDCTIIADWTESTASTATDVACAQFDAFAEGGTGGVITGAVFNSRTSSASTWVPDGGQLFGFAAEASLSRPSAAEVNVFGGNIQAKLLAGSSGVPEVCGLEINTVTEVLPAYRTGLLIAANPRNSTDLTENLASSGIDAAIMFSNKERGARWRDGLLFYVNNSTAVRFPIASSGSLLRVEAQVAVTIENGIDLSTSNLTITNHAFKSPGFNVTGAGLITSSAAGTHTFQGASTATVGLQIRNTQDSTAAHAFLRIGAVENAQLELAAFNTSYEAADGRRPLGALVLSNSTGGLTLRASSGQVRILANGSTLARVTVSTGVQIGAPVGGDKGAGTLNVSGDIYKNDSAFTNPDFVFEHAFTGQIVQFAGNPGASDYAGLTPSSEVESFAMAQFRFPQLAKDSPRGAFARVDTLLELVEQQFLYICDLRKRVKKLERRGD